MSFIPLHVHSQLSVLDGAIKISEYVDKCIEYGFPAAAITDHGNLHGTLSFYKEGKKKNFKTLLGVEAYCTSDPDGAENRTRDNEHFILIAKNNQGFKDLMWLISNANINNFYYKPRIWYKHLEGRGENLCALTACLASRIASLLIYNQDLKRIITGFDEAERSIDYFRDIFGKNLYLEIQSNSEDKQAPYNLWLIEMARKKKIPLTITTDAHYLNKEDYQTHKLMMAMQLRKSLDEYDAGDKMKYGPDYYIKTEKEMLEAATIYGAPEAVENTISVADQCQVDIELGHHYFPVFDIQKAEDYQEFLKWKEEQNAPKEE